MTVEQKQKLFEVLTEYEEREFLECAYKNPDEIPEVIPMGYTTSDNEQHEVQVNFDTRTLEWKEYIDGELKTTSKRDSIEEFIDEIDGIDFDSIVSDILYMANQMEKEEE